MFQKFWYKNNTKIWQDHINNIAIWLNKANAMLHEVRQIVNERTLISIYHAIFDSHLNYASIVWCQTKRLINRVLIIQKKALEGLQNYILCIISVWSILCSVRLYKCLYFLPILLVKLSFHFSMFQCFVFLFLYVFLFLHLCSFALFRIQCLKRLIDMV